MSGPELVLNDCDESLPLFVAPDAGPAMPLRSLASHADASAAFVRALPPSGPTSLTAAALLETFLCRHAARHHYTWVGERILVHVTSSRASDDADAEPASPQESAERSTALADAT